MGNEAFKRRLLGIPASIRAEVEAAVAAAGEELAATIRSVTPHRTGALQASVRVEPVEGAGGNTLRVRVRAGGATLKRIRKSATAPLVDYSTFQEWGTHEMPANPYFYPTYRLRRRALQAKISRAVRKAVQRAAAQSGFETR